MTTGYEAILAEVETRLTTPSDFMGGGYGTKRGHLTGITLEQAPGAHIVGGDDAPQKTTRNCTGRYGDFTVSIFTRDDAGSAAADSYVLELYERMAAPFAPGIVVTPGLIHRETEIGDNDCARTDCRFDVTYTTVGEWSIEYAAP